MQPAGAQMSDPRDEIARIIADAEKAAYQRGWNEATIAMAVAASQLRNPTYRHGHASRKRVRQIGPSATWTASLQCTGDCQRHHRGKSGHGGGRHREGCASL